MRGVGKFTLLLVVLALVGADLTACGSDDSGETTAPADADKTAPAAAGDSPAATGAEGSASFRVQGGDNSIQGYGEEVDGSELEAAEAALVGYLDARTTDDWAKQCRYLAKATIEPLEQLAANAPQLKGQGCPAVLEQLTAGVPASTRANPMNAGLASLRAEEDRGFALFHGAEGVDYFIPMVKEGDDWKVGALAASEFP